MSAKPRKIAYVRLRAVLPFTRRTGEILQEVFPEYEVEVVDMWQLFNQSRLRTLRNAVDSLTTYGFDLARRRRRLAQSLLKTPYAFATMRALVRRRLPANDYAFTFQTQSHFDWSREGVPNFVYTDHTHLANLYYPDFDRRTLLPNSWVDLERSIYRNAAKVLTWSAHVSRSLKEHYALPDEKIACVYFATNARIENDPAIRPDYESKNVLFLGFNWKRKGGPDLIAAWSRVVKEHPEATLTIVGAAPEVDVPNCRVVGPVPLERVNTYYQAASVYCLPTTLEPFGISFIEALANKLPIVATNVGAIPDFVADGHNGYLVHPHDIEGLAQRLSHILSDQRQREVFGARGHALAKERYSWEAVGRRLREEILPFVS